MMLSIALDSTHSESYIVGTEVVTPCKTTGENMSLPTGFTSTDNTILENPKLSLQAKTIYTIIKAFTFNKGECYPSQDTLCKVANCSRRSLCYYIKELEEEGLVVRSKKGRSTVYKFKEAVMKKEERVQPVAHDECNMLHTNKRKRKRVKNKEIYKESLNYPIAQQLVTRYIDSLPNLLSSRKSTVFKTRAIKHLTVRLDKGEDLERLERATECAIKEQAETDKQYVIGPCNFFSPNKKTGGKFQMFLTEENKDIMAGIEWGGDA